MQQTSCVNERIAQRIERAYLRRRPEWRLASVDRQLWASAARVLLAASASEPGIPVDPELFVASQVKAGLISDPWMDLTRPRAGHRYVAQIQKIVRNLRSELDDELNLADDAMLDGKTLEMVLLSPTRKLSALGRYLIAMREERPDLAKEFRSAAREQMEICPLYEMAIADLIASEDAPHAPEMPGPARSPGSMNYHLN